MIEFKAQLSPKKEACNDESTTERKINKCQHYKNEWTTKQRITPFYQNVTQEGIRLLATKNLFRPDSMIIKCFPVIGSQAMHLNSKFMLTRGISFVFIPKIEGICFMNFLHIIIAMRFS